MFLDYYDTIEKFSMLDTITNLHYIKPFIQSAGKISNKINYTMFYILIWFVLLLLYLIKNHKKYNE
jgi:hypothetical protein